MNQAGAREADGSHSPWSRRSAWHWVVFSSVTRMASLSQGLEPRGVKGVLVTTVVLENQVSHCSPKSQMWGLSLGALGSVAMVTTNVSAASCAGETDLGSGFTTASWGRKHRHILGTSCSSCPTPSPQPGWWGSPGKCERTGGQVVPVGSGEVTDSHEVPSQGGAQGRRVQGQACSPGVLGMLKTYHKVITYAINL